MQPPEWGLFYWSLGTAFLQLRAVSDSALIASLAFSRPICAQQDICSGKQMTVFAVCTIGGHPLVGLSSFWPACAIPRPCALFAFSLAFIPARVVRRVFVAARALSLKQVGMWRGITTKDILSASHGF